MTNKQASKRAAAGAVGDLENVAKARIGRIPKVKTKPALAAPLKAKSPGNLKANNSASVTPEESTSFRGSSSSHKKPLAKAPKMSQREQSAEFERIAKAHGAEGSEEAFNGMLRKLAKPKQL